MSDAHVPADRPSPQRPVSGIYDVAGRFDDLDSAIRDLCRKTVLGQHLRITHCASQLSEAQFWWRPRPEMNSVANLMLHLRGNVGQWIVAGVGGRPFERDRPEEFAVTGGLAKVEVESQLAAMIAEATDVIASLAKAQLLAPVRVQGFETTGIGALLHAVSHFEGHGQEIVSLTRQQLGNAYIPLWTPKTPEQASSA